MRCLQILLSIALYFITLIGALPEDRSAQAGLAHAQDAPVSKICKQMRALKVYTNLAKNQTKLDRMLDNGKFDADQIKWIKLNTPGFIAQLGSLESNTTLVTMCQEIKQHKKVVRKCKQIKKLEKLAELERNETAYNEHLASKILNQKQLEWLHKKMANAEQKLQKLKGNGTLVVLCSNQTFLQQSAALESQADDDDTNRIATSNAISDRLGCRSTTFLSISILMVVFVIL